MFINYIGYVRWCNLESNVIQISQKNTRGEFISLISNSHKQRNHVRFEYLVKKNMHVKILKLVKYGVIISCRKSCQHDTHP